MRSTLKENEDEPIIHYINTLLKEAVTVGASDLHFEPYEKNFRIRLRRDGILYEHAVPPLHLVPRIVVRLKVMAHLDIAERRMPQDGRFKLKFSSEQTIDFRVSTCPTLFGEKIVMRIQDPNNAKTGIEALGFEPFQQTLFLDAIHKPQGMVLVTGPTGSGKTISLYTALHILNTEARNISTCEDPIEIPLPGINQVSVNNKAGLNFATALRAFLRQDPDIIMIGEIRDLETAEMAVKAAQTGHLVLSTVHTNSAAETLTRLINIGIPAYHLATSLNLVIAQRLARVLCSHCKKIDSLPGPVLIEAGFTSEEIKLLTFYKATGCEKCKNGYRGRMAIVEIMPLSKTLANTIMQGGNAIEIVNKAKQEGMWDLRQAGLHKIKLGLTTLEEINRITKD